MAKTSKIGKAEFIDMVTAKANESIEITKKDTKIVVEAVFSSIVDCMNKGINITIINFGSFVIQKVKARKGRNINDGSVINIPAHKRVKFTAGKDLKEAVEKKKK